MRNLTIGILGGGHLANSIVTGLLKSEISANNLYLYDYHLEKREFFATNYNINLCENVDLLIKASQVFILCIKPQDILKALPHFKEALKIVNPLCISVAAGISLKSLQKHLDSDSRFIRAMPNINAKMQMSATGLYADTHLSLEDKKTAEWLFKALGWFTWVKQESSLDLLTALSGSGPAYFLSMLEGLVEGITHLGLEPTLARQFTLQTCLGTAKLAQSEGTSLKLLKQQIVSKGGTTEQALKVLEKADFHPILEKTLKAAFERTKTLGETLND